MSILLDGGKKTGRGTLKGIAAVAKRGMHLSQKQKIEFSAKRGGPCGENRYIFGRSGYVYKENGSTNLS